VIIESVRLKNIKCYGEGAGGEGITISFQPGINRIAGRNGHGKSTIIESLGYALFLTKPEFEENFDFERYLLRHGAKEGEVDITFSHGHERFRVERGIGRQSKRRSKVIQLSNGSLCAENDDEVSRFLCQLLGFPDPDRLCEIFSKLLGVRQGRMTWPFDSKPRAAKEFFEPLLDVAIFRECFDKLKPVVETFERQLHQDQTRHAEIQTRAKDRADSEQQLIDCRKRIENEQAALQTASDARAAAAVETARLETLEAAARNATVQAGTCQQSLTNAASLHELARHALQESQSAAVKVLENRAAYEACNAATKALTELETRRSARDALRERLARRDHDRVESEAKLQAAQTQIKEFTELKAAKEQSRSEWQAKAAPLRDTLALSRANFDRAREAIRGAEARMTVVRETVAALAARVHGQRETAARIQSLNAQVAAWDPTRLTLAAKAEEAAQVNLETVRENLANATTLLKTLQHQTDEIAGGLCPFLKEKCRQFDPAKVKADLQSCRTKVSELQAAARLAQASQQAAKQQHDAVKASHQEVINQDAHLRQALGQYLEALKTIILNDATEAAAWLNGWDQTIALLPLLPEIRGESVPPDSIAGLQGRLEAYGAEVRAWWKAADATYSMRRNDFHEQELARRTDELNLANIESTLQTSQSEIQEFEKKIARRHREAAQEELTRKAAADEVAVLAEQLKCFATLDTELETQRSRQKVNRSGYESYLQAQELAALLTGRETRLVQCHQALEAARLALTQAVQEKERACAAFDPASLAAGRTQLQKRSEEVAGLAATLEAHRKDLASLQVRFAEWQQACQELLVVETEMARCQASIDLAELARKTLRDSAPEVARHLCQRIASAAQRVFNQISPEPITLQWDSDRYSLEVGPGERRFAMLSGGEQTKLALAMTLAMIEQFCSLRFCVFDEPTYGVDTDSRQKLAETILEVQQAAGLEQLLLVSHDDAFEGKIEHSIILAKTAGAGTQAMV
jgi:DNA repair protein SbcC/Rad50